MNRSESPTVEWFVEDGIRLLKHSGPWTERSQDRWLAEGGPGLFLTLDESTPSLDFLARLSGLRHVMTVGSCEDDSALEELSVDYLCLSHAQRRTLDVSRLAALRTLRVDFARVVVGAERLTTLEELRIGSRGTTLQEICGSNRGLHTLELSKSRMVSLGGLEQYPRIRQMMLFRVGALAQIGLQYDHELAHLALDWCPRLSVLDGAEHLRDLVWIRLENCPRIGTLKPLLTLPKLAAMALIGSTHIQDESVRDIVRLPHMQDVCIIPLRPSYKLRMGDLPNSSHS